MKALRPIQVATFFLLVALVALPVQAQGSEDVPAYLRHVEGDVTVHRVAVDAAEPGIANLPLESGDRLTTGARGRAEIVLPDGTYVAVDEYGDIDIVSLAADVGENVDAILRLRGGSILVRRESQETGFRARAPRVDTANGSAVLTRDALVRVDVDDEQRVWLSVFEGSAELVAGGMTEPLRSGERSYAEQGTAPAQAESFNTAESDGFYGWYHERVEGRAQLVQYVSEQREYVPSTVAYQAADLEPYGSWSYYSGVGTWGWRPAYSAGWSPYRNGRWVYTYGGWTWVPYSSWGWVTTHYGRWHFQVGYGWAWFPGRVYSPAWVHWYVGGGYVGWCPLNYYNRPYVSLNYYFGNRGHGYGGGRGDYGYGQTGRVVKGRGYTDGVDDSWKFVRADDLGRGAVNRSIVDSKLVARSAQSRNSASLQGRLRARDPAAIFGSASTRQAVPKPTVGIRGNVGSVSGSSRAVPRPATGGNGMVRPRPGGTSQGIPAVRPRPGGTSPRPSAVKPRPSGTSQGIPGVRPRPGGTSPRPSAVKPRPGGTSQGIPGVRPRPGTNTGPPKPTAIRRPSSGARPPYTPPRPSSLSRVPAGYRPPTVSRPPPAVSRPSMSRAPSISRPSAVRRPTVTRAPSGYRPPTSVRPPTIRRAPSSSRPPSVGRSRPSSPPRSAPRRSKPRSSAKPRKPGD